MLVYTVVMAQTYGDMDPGDPDYDDYFGYRPEDVVRWQLVVNGDIMTPAIFQDEEDAQKLIDMLHQIYQDQAYKILHSEVVPATPRPTL